MKPFIVKLAFIGASVLFSVSSCQKEKLSSSESDTPKAGIRNEVVSKEVKTKFASMAINTGDILPYNMAELNGEVTEGYLAHDIFIPKKSLWTMQSYSTTSAGRTQLYKTNTIDLPASGTKTINMIAYTGSTIGDIGGLNQAEQDALTWAVKRYNDLKLKISFKLSFSTDLNTTLAAQTYVTRDTDDNKDGGFANFPVNGAPGKRIIVNQKTRDNGTKALRHVFVHEIGHTIGLIHSDYRTRLSCNEPSPGEVSRYFTDDNGYPTAVHIPGTDQSGNLITSVMKACYTIDVDQGVFTSEDKKALGIIYGK